MRAIRLNPCPYLSLRKSYSVKPLLELSFFTYRILVVIIGSKLPLALDVIEPH